jgi:signal transduction histidine kinase
MRAAAQLLVRRVRSGEYPRGEVSLINTIMQQSELMTRLVEELLDVSRLQSGRLQIHTQPFDMVALVREVMNNSQLSNPGFTFDLEASGSAWVIADRDRIEQVVGNLFDNAVKYVNGPGSIRIRVESLPEQELARVEVHDNGIGFEPSAAERIFERFSRLTGVAHHARGMGLGLFICRQIIAAHGGTISASSPGPGRGATFTFTLPLAPIADEE